MLAAATLAPLVAGNTVLPAPLAPSARPNVTSAVPPSEPLIAVTLLLAGFAVVTGVTTTASALRERGVLPAALGPVAVAVQVGLYYAGALTQHSTIAGTDPYSGMDLLDALAAIALLIGGSLVLVAAVPRGAPAPAGAAPSPMP